MTEAQQLKRKLDSVSPGSREGTRLTQEEISQLIASFQEIADTNLELITEFERSRKGLMKVERTMRRTVWEVAAAIVLGLVVVGAGYLQLERVADANASVAVQAKRTDENVTKTLEVVRAISEALSSKVQADVAALGPTVTDEDLNAKQAAEEAQRKALTVEVEVQNDPAKKQAASKKLERLREKEREEISDDDSPLKGKREF